MNTRDIRLLAKAVISPPDLKVNFVVAGAQKGGTTALNRYLRSHPQICLPRKEVHFFDTDLYFDPRHVVRYGLRYRYYHSHFKLQPLHRVIGEITPSYLYWAEAPRRIWEYNPEMKLIMVLRNPTTRAFSHWNMQHQRGIEPLSFWDAIHKEEERYRKSMSRHKRSKCIYVDRGFYTEQLRRVWHFFRREQTLVFKSEELKHQPQDVLRKTYAFLGLEDVALAQPLTAHVRDYAVRLEAREQEYLQRIYEYEIKALERMLDWDCSDWLCERTTA